MIMYSYIVYSKMQNWKNYWIGSTFIKLITKGDCARVSHDSTYSAQCVYWHI